MKNITIVLVLFFLYGCAMLTSGPPKEFSVIPNESLDSKSSIIIGRITTQRLFGVKGISDNLFGRGFAIKNIGTGKEFIYTGGRFFYFKVPEGNYEISTIASRAGRLAPKVESFKFKSISGKIIYIGSFLVANDIPNLVEQAGNKNSESNSAIITNKEYGIEIVEGLLAKGSGVGREPFIPFFLVDERENVISEFYKLYPQYNDQEVIVSFAY